MEKKLSVGGMTCPNCVKRVKKIIEKHEGVSEAAVSLETGEAVVTCSDATDLSGMVKAINDFGFTAAEKG